MPLRIGAPCLVTQMISIRSLNDHIRIDIPLSPVGTKNAEITFVTGAGVILEGNGGMNAGTGWKYNKDTGEFICNHADWD